MEAMFSRLSKSTLVLLAFGSVYIFWGSTYGAIRIAGEHLPVPVVSAARCLISALLMACICLLRRKSMRVPSGEAWKLIIVGLLFMSCNNMLLTWGEKLLPSGFASLIVSTMPIMIALIERSLPGGDALNKRGWTGTLLGTLGIGVLVWPSLHPAHGAAAADSHALLGVVILLGAALAFAVGSVLSRRFQFTADTFVATGWQVGAAGIFNAALAFSTGAWSHAEWTWTGFGAVLYLAIFGSIFGLVALTYLLQNVAVTKVSTYAFVNPIVAVLLGVLLLHEHLGKTEIAGMAVIVCAVAMVVYSRVDRGKSEIVGMAGEAVE
jgi:drug/metabolite transporter (DMT)-like permease